MKLLTTTLLITTLAFNVFAQTTYIEVKAGPDYFVFLDGSFKGKTSLELGGFIIENVASGSHTLRLVKGDFVEERSISVKAGEIFRYTLGTTPATNNNQSTEEFESKAEEASIVQYELGTFVDERDDRTYKTIQIGEQVWMAENLAWRPNLNLGKYRRDYFAYENKMSNVEIHGYLYTWKVAMEACPEGWHLPTDDDWTTLTDYLGGSDSAAIKLKKEGTTFWENSNNQATNETKFSAIPGGILTGGTMKFSNKETLGFWWTSTPEGNSEAWFRFMHSRNNSVERRSILRDTQTGLSCRCIKD